MPRKYAVPAAGLALLAWSLPGLAQSGPDGGLLEGAGSHKTELVVGATELTVYLIEDGKPHPSKGTSLRAVIQQPGGKTSALDFADADGRLVARLTAPLEAGAIVVLSGKDHHGERLSARYVIK